MQHTHRIIQAFEGKLLDEYVFCDRTEMNLNETLVNMAYLRFSMFFQDDYRSETKKTLLAVIFFFVTPVFHAQQTSLPNSSHMDVPEQSIRYERNYLQYTQTKNGFVKFQSILKRTSDSVTYNGRSSRAVTQRYYMPNHIDVDSSICDLQTLLPKAYYSKIPSEGYSEEVIFTSTTIQSKTTLADSTKTRLHPNKMLYSGVMEDELISNLNFNTDSTFKIHVVNPGLMFMEYLINVRVLGKEYLDLPDGRTIRCWKLDVNSGTKHGATVWYAEKNRIQIKKTFLLPDGNLFVRVLLYS